MATQEEYDDILRYKTAVEGRQKYRAGLTKNQKRNIRDKASRYKVEQQCLYIVEEDKDLGVLKERRVVVKQDEKERILKMCHSGVDGMHFGRDKTYKKVRFANVLINVVVAILSKCTSAETRHGWPKVVQSDQGQEFVNACWRR